VNNRDNTITNIARTITTKKTGGEWRKIIRQIFVVTLKEVFNARKMIYVKMLIIELNNYTNQTNIKLNFVRYFFIFYLKIDITPIIYKIVTMDSSAVSLTVKMRY
jgi:hypothetical protein